MIAAANLDLGQRRFVNPAATAIPALRAGGSLDQRTFHGIRRRAVLEGCKWDPQVGDVSTLASFPLILRRDTWNELATLTEQLSTETLQAEQELLQRPELLSTLGLPRAVGNVLKHPAPATPSAVRVMRFDFHPTRYGWQISEVNSDVPGGFTEASFFTGLIAEHFPGARPTGNPIERWADAIAAAGGNGGNVGLLTAPGFMEDHQIVAYLAGHLRARGCEPHLANPTQLSWKDAVAHLETDWHKGSLNSIVRFFQCEWLPHLRRCDWQKFFRGSRTPVGNPGTAVIAESKRFPLAWDALQTSLPTWRALLPKTCDVREVNWRTDESWVIKATLGNTGDEVCIRELIKKRDWRRLRWDVWLRPTHWVAQRRFDSQPIATPLGPMHVCLGVYSINGKAAGIYARLAQRPLIDYASVDAAVLVDNDP